MTIEDIKIAKDIFGPSILVLKGKTRHTKPSPVIYDIVNVPNNLKNLHKVMILDADVFFVNNIPFLCAISHNVEFTTSLHLHNQTKKQLVEVSKKSAMSMSNMGLKLY